MTVRLIQVGMGSWGKSWATRVVAQNKAVEPVAWVEIDAVALERARQQLSLPAERCFLSLDEALAQVDADAVLITASLPGHVPNATTALQADKHVLMEKPFAPAVSEARQLVALAEQHKRVLMISQNYRYAPAVRKVIDLVHEQVVGSIGSVNIDFRRNANAAPIETNRHYHIWEPLLADMAIHHFDLMRAVLGQEPRLIYCKTWNPSWSHFDEPPSATMTITFDAGTVVSYRGSWVSPGPQTNWSGDWRMEGERGELVWTSRGDQPDRVLLRPLNKRPRAVRLPELEHLDRAGSLQAFVQAVRSGEPPETSGRNNLNTLAFMFAAIEAARSGLPVEIARSEASASGQS